MAPLSLALALSLAAPAQVWIVDDSGGAGVDFVSLQAAIDAAAEGDTLLIKGGEYAGAIVHAKSLQLVEEAGEDARISAGRLTICNLAPHQSVVVRGLSARSINASGPGLPVEDTAALLLQNNAGPVWVEGGEFVRPSAPLPQPLALVGGPGALVQDCASVTLVDCVFFAAGGLFDTPDQAQDLSGLSARNSSIAAYSCTFDGGAGSSGGGGVSCGTGEASGAGLALAKGELFAAHCILRGGHGQPGVDSAGLSSPSAGGSGGHGLWLLGAQLTKADLWSCTLVPGQGGPGGEHIDGFVVCDDAPDGQALLSEGHPTSESVAPLRQAHAISPVRTGQSAQVTLGGDAFELVVLVVSGSFAHAQWAGLSGLGVVSVPFAVLPFGALDGAGSGSLAVPVPPLPAGVEARQLLVQGVHVDAALGLWWAEPTSLSVLDAALAP